MDFLKTFAPANLANLNEDELAQLQNLTPEQIHQLAEAYPNSSAGVAYLVYKDNSIKDDRKQLYPVGSWQNLSNILKLGQTNISAFGAKANFQRPATTKATVGKVQDLTEDEAKKAPGLKKAPVKNIQEDDDFDNLDNEANQKAASKKAATKKAASKKGK
jgi:hypothetical protein